MLPGPTCTLADALAAAGRTASKWSHHPIPPEAANEHLETGQRIIFTLKGDGPPELVIEPMAPATRFTLGFKLDLNRVSETDLLLLPQMKPEWADIIVERRKQMPWKRVEDLNDIPGIGPKTIEKWRPTSM